MKASQMFSAIKTGFNQGSRQQFAAQSLHDATGAKIIAAATAYNKANTIKPAKDGAIEDLRETARNAGRTAVARTLSEIGGFRVDSRKLDANAVRADNALAALTVDEVDVPDNATAGATGAAA